MDYDKVCDTVYLILGRKSSKTQPCSQEPNNNPMRWADEQRTLSIQYHVVKQREKSLEVVRRSLRKNKTKQKNNITSPKGQLK